jgi:predicted dehydrogenase
LPDEIGIGFVGHGWIAGVHARALRTLDQLNVLPKRVKLVHLAGRDDGRAAEAASRLGFERSSGDWRRLAEDGDVDVVANLSVESAHPETSIGALEAGKSVLCEKPLALSGPEAERMAEAADRAGKTAACGYSFRFTPAIQLARELVEERIGGRPLHFRGTYNIDYAVFADDEDKAYDPAGGGMIAGLSHLLDTITVFVDDPISVMAETVRFPRSTDGDEPLWAPPRHEEDAYAAVMRTKTGALASASVSNHATGSGINGHEFTVETTEGAVHWSGDNLNHLDVYMRRDEDEGLPGFKRVMVTEEDHPFLKHWWPRGLPVGWDALFVHQWLVFLQAVLDGAPVGEGQATFRDAVHTAKLCDAIMQSAAEGRRLDFDSHGDLI